MSAAGRDADAGTVNRPTQVQERAMRSQKYRVLLALVAAAATVPLAEASQPASAAPASAPASPTTAPADPACDTATAASLATFFDDEVPRLLRKDQIPGAVVSVASGDRTAFTGG